VTASGKDVIGDWLATLRDPRAVAKILVRIDRLASGNFGDTKSLRDGVRELRIHWGPGYRVYYALVDRTCLLLLCGGDKRGQSSDIDKAVEYWKDYQQRTERE